MKEMGLDAKGLEYLLWDRILHRQLSASGKPHLVSKTPSDVFIADRIKECWPDAKFIFLLRHPAAIARSRQAARPQDTPERNARMVLRYGGNLEEARSRHEGLVVRYEELAAEPERVMREVCGFLGLPWDPGVLDYGRHDHGRYKAGMGDWSQKIRSGRIQPPEPVSDDEIRPELRELAAAWGYLPADTPAAPAPSSSG